MSPDPLGGLRFERVKKRGRRRTGIRRVRRAEEPAAYGDGTCHCGSGHTGCLAPSRRANEARRLLSCRTEAPC